MCFSLVHIGMPNDEVLVVSRIALACGCGQRQVSTKGRLEPGEHASLT